MGDYLIMNPLNFPILSTTIFIPVVGALLLLVMRNDTLVKVTAFTAGIINFIISLLIYVHFDPTTHLFQFGEFARWIPSYNINYILGIDGITIFLILLTTILAPICVLCSWTAI